MIIPKLLINPFTNSIFIISIHHLYLYFTDDYKKMMNCNDKDTVCEWISQPPWTNHIKAGARSQWRRKHEPHLITRVPLK